MQTFLNLALAFVLAGTAQANFESGGIKNIWQLNDMPDPSQIRAWTRLPGSRAYQVKLKDPSSYELRLLATLPGASAIKIVLERFPSGGDLIAWQTLARAVSLEISLDVTSMPTPAELDTLAKIGASRIELTTSRFLYEAEAMALNRVVSAGPELKNLRLVFLIGSYPTHMEFPALDLLSTRFALEIVAAATPSRVDVSWLNMIRHTIDLNLQNRWFTPSHTQELRSIARLRRVSLTTVTQPPSLDAFEPWKGVPIRWIKVGSLPSQVALTAFSEQHKQDPFSDPDVDALSLRVSSDVSGTDRARLQALGITTSIWSAAP
jgi:hypothetical protein